MTVNDIRANLLFAIALGYRDISRLNESEFEAAHIMLRSQVAAMGIDPDSLRDTCAGRADQLDKMGDDLIS